jgi:hypothetical protein
MKKKKFVVVTTDATRRGVFAGLLVSGDIKTGLVKLESAQMCIYWSGAIHGVLGLAATGPNEECRIGPPVPQIELNGVTAILDATEAAQAAWERQPWQR